MKTISLLRLQARSWYRLTLILCALTFAFGNAWADPDYTKNNNNTPYNFTTSGCSGWTPYNTKSGGYCGATGSKGGDWYVLNSNISEFKAVNFNNYENVSLTIYVKAAINGGTNTYTVKLLDKDGNEISGTGYSATKENGMGSGSTASSDAKESSVSLSPTKAFAGYKIEFKTKSYITQTRYVLTYDDKAAVSCSNKVTVTKVAPENGSFNVYQGSVSNSNLLSFTNNQTTVDNCGSGTTTLVVVPQANNHYHVSNVTATNKKTGTSITQSNGQYTIQYAQGGNVSSSITVAFAEDDHSSIVLNDANGDGDAITNKYVEENYTLPTTAASCTGKTFVGWSTVEVSKTNTKPTSNFYEPGATYTNLPASIKFYAVYAKVTESTTKFKRVTSVSDITEGEKVAIVNNATSKILGLNDGGTDYTAESAPTETSSQIDKPSNNNLWTASKSGNYWEFTNCNTTTKKIATSNSSSQSQLNASSQTYTKFELGASSYSTNMFYLRLYNGSSMTNCALQYYSNNNTSAWQVYAPQSNNNPTYSSNQNVAAKLYVPVKTYSAYATGCEACAVDPTIGAAGLKSAGAYGLDGVEVSVSGMSTGSDACEWTDYGFYWGTSANKKANKKQVGTNGNATSFEATLAFEAPTQLATSTTYYYCAYGKNSKSGATIAYGTEASFTPQSVTFSMNGHGSQVATQYVNNGGTATDPGTTSITGYTFNGWKLNSSAYSFSSAVTSDITLVADWSVKSHTLTWTTTGDALTGDYTGKSGDVDYGTTIDAPNTPTKTGYTFAGWTPAVAPTMPDNDLTYTATWTAKTTAITLNKNNEDAEGSNAGSASWTYDQTTKNSYSTATRTGYTVEGYYTAASGGTKILNADGSLAGNAITVDEVVYTNDGKWAYNGTELTLYAHWTANTYKVVFKANGGTGNDVEQTGFTYDESKTLTSLETIGFTAPEHKYFLGWNTNSSATTAAYEDEASVSNLSSTNNGSVNLYAIWKDHTYTNYRTKCCTPLAAPANIEVSVTGAATATVTWDAVADATGYEYKLGDGEWTTASVTGAETKTLSLSGLDGASDYTIYVRTNGDGDNCAEGTASAGTNFRTYSTVTAAMNDPLMGTAKVSLNNSDWYDAVETTDGTTIYLQATPGSLYNFSNWATPSSGSISSNQLTGWSGDVTVTANFVAKQLTKLDTPTGMGLVGEPGATSATIKWNKVDHASGYQVVCAGAEVGDVTVIDGVASCPLTILTANTTYNWTVKALGDGISFEDGDACASQSFTTDKKKPTAIEITHAPTVTEYLEGESFATAGMVVKVTYNNGDIDGAYSDYTINPSGALEFGTTYVTVTASLNEVSVSTTQAITVHKKYTLTFKNNGSIVETKNLKEGDAYGTFPSAGDACDGTSTTFMGWSTAEISEKQSAAPASYASTTDVMGTKNVVLNAVWAKQTGQSGYKLVSAPTSGKKYVFVSSNAAGSAYAVAATSVSTSTTSGTKAASAPVTISSGTPVYISTVNENLEFAFDGSDYEIVGTLASNTERKYLHINGSYVGRRTASDANIMWDSDKGLYGQNGDKDKNYYLYLNSTVFDKAESPAEGARVYAFEKQEASYTDYLTTCCDEWSVTASYGEGNVISVSDGAVAVTLSDLAYGTASYESSDEDVLTVASDGKITGKKAGSATVTIAWAGIAGSKCAFETTVDVTVNGPITLTYNANDGTLTPATTIQNATSNTAFTLDANSFSRTGYTFQGWATTPSGDKVYNDSQADVEFAEDVTLYAVWAINLHTVTLTQPTGNTITANSSTTPGNVTYGTTVNLTATENDGYVFTGWSVTGITLADATANPAQFTMPDNAVSVSANYTHYTWDLTGYTVETAPETEYSTGDHFSKASVVIKAGYERSDTKETKQVAVDAANWTAKLNGTEIADNYTFVIGDNGKTLTLWVGDTQVGENYVLTVNAIPTDHFVINIWTNEVSPIADKTIAYSMPNLSDQTAGAAATCKDHNLFVGWVEADYKDEPEGHIVAANTAMTPSDKTFYAVWGKTGTITESISYGWETGDDASNWSMSASKDGLNAVTAYHKTGEKAGATTSTGAHIRTLSSYATPKSISAQILKQGGNTTTGNVFKLQYSNNASDWNDIVTKEFKDLTKEVWFELSYDLSNNDTYKNKYFRVVMVSAANGAIDDVTFTYATSRAVDYITECVQRYQITFDANGGTGSYDAIEKKEGATVTLPDGSALSRQWHNFDGWKVYNATTDEEIAVTENSFTTPAANVNVVAQWQEVSKAKVVYMNGDDQYSTRPNIHEGEEYTIAGKPADQEGKLFIGWKNTLTSDTMKVKDPALKVIMPTPAVDIRYDALWLDVLPEPTSSTVDAADLSNGEWVLVTANNQLRTGDIVIVAAKDSPFALGSTQNSSNRASVSITKSEDKQRLSNPDGNVAKLFLQNGIGAGEYALYDYAYVTNETNGGYLYAAGNSSNDLKTKTSLDRDASWTITISNDDAAATIKAKGQYSHNWLRHNKSGSNNLFSCYASGQNDVVLYKWVKKISGSTNLSGIELTDAVIVKNGATLTVDAANSLVDLTVEAGGKVETTNELTVINNLLIKTSLGTISGDETNTNGKSGEITNGNNIVANGDVFIEIELTQEDKASTGWYAFSVPFPVDAINGVYYNDTKLTNEVGYAIMSYHGDVRAQGQYAWKKYRGIMQPGTLYIITVGKTYYKTLRFKKVAGADLIASNEIAVKEYPLNGGTTGDNGWNGIGNPNLQVSRYTGSYLIQFLDHQANSFKVRNASAVNLMVGSAFMMQSTATKNITITAGNDGSIALAPAREMNAEENTLYEVKLRNNTTNIVEDNLFFMAREDATNSYETGYDLVKLSMGEAKCAQMYVPAYGTKLCAADFRLVNDKAEYPLTITAPADGTYRIETPTESEDATLYLTKDGRAIWNLSMSACEVELSKGTTENYGLLLVRKAPGVATGMENVQSDNVQCTKVIIDNQVFILRGGQMYDVTGKAVK